MSDQAPLLIGADEAAHLLGISKSLVYKLAQRKQIEHVKIGKAVRFSRTAIESFCATSVVPQAEEPAEELYPRGIDL